MASAHRTKINSLFIVGLMSLYMFSSMGTANAESNIFWHAYKGDGAHSGFINQNVEKKLSLHWRYFFRGDYANPLQVIGDKIYFLDRSGFVCCINRMDGSEVYRVQVDEKRIILGMDVSKDAIVVATGPVLSRRGIEEISCVLYSLSLDKGEKLWQKKINVIMITPPIIEEDKVWIASGKLDPTFSKTSGGDLICFNVKSGEEIYSTAIEDYAFYGNYLTMSEGIILAQGLKYDRTSRTQMPPRLFAFSEKTGNLVWEQDPLDENRMFGTPSVKDGFIYITENPGFFGSSRRRQEAWLMKFNLKTGKLEKSMNIPQETFGNFSPTLSNDAIYINSFTGKIYAIDYEMDRIYWVKRLDRFSYFTELTATKNYLFTCLYSGEIIAVSKEDGNVHFRYRIGNYGGIPVVADDQLLVTGDVLYCFSSKAEPILYTEPTSLSFEKIQFGEVKQLSFRVIYTGFEKMTGTVSCSENWLKVRPDTFSSNIQTCFVTLESSKAPPGKIQANIMIETDRGSKIIPVEAEIVMPTPLPLEVNINKDGLLTNQRTFMMLGQTEPLTKVYINDWMVFANENGRFSHVVALKEGVNHFQLVAVSKDNRKAELNRIIQLDTIPPDLNIESFEKAAEALVYKITGNTEPDAVIEILDETYPVETDGHFSIELISEESLNKLEIKAVDKAGNITSKIITQGLLADDVFFQ